MTECDRAIKYIIEHLEIYIEQNTEFGPVEEITVKLSINGKEISRSSCTLPNLTEVKS